MTEPVIDESSTMKKTANHDNLEEVIDLPSYKQYGFEHVPKVKDLMYTEKNIKIRRQIVDDLDQLNFKTTKIASMLHMSNDTILDDLTWLVNESIKWVKRIGKGGMSREALLAHQKLGVIERKYNTQLALLEQTAAKNKSMVDTDDLLKLGESIIKTVIARANIVSNHASMEAYRHAISHVEKAFAEMNDEEKEDVMQMIPDHFLKKRLEDNELFIGPRQPEEKKQ